MSKFSEVHCYYTGGGVYVYSAKYGDNYLYGSLDQTIDCFSVRGEVLFHDEDVCESFGWLDEMKSFNAGGHEMDYYLGPDDVQYPTWQEILDSLRLDPEDGMCNGAAEALMIWNLDLSKLTCDEGE